MVEDLAARMAQLDLLVLPAEIEQPIFEMAAYNHPGTAAVLAQVAKYILPWVAPMMYNFIIVGMRNRPREPSLAALRRHGHFVRHMFIGQADSVEVVEEQLTSCPNIQDLALWMARVLDDKCLQIIKRLPLRRLQTYIHTIFQSGRMARQAQSLFPHFKELTHLVIYSICSAEPLPPCLKFLPKLKYLALPVGFATESPSAFLNGCPGLEMLLLLNDGFRGYEEDTKNVTPSDPLEIVRLRFPNFVTDWKLGVRGGMDSWAHATKLHDAVPDLMN